MKRGLVAACIVLAACPKKEANKPPLPTPSDAPVAQPRDAATAAPYDPAVRAKQILDVQVAALKTTARTDSALLATFTADALLLVPDPRAVTDTLAGFRDAITRRAPHETVKDVLVSDVAAAGNASALWFTCTLTIVQDDGNETVQVTELATVESGWKVTVAAFAEPDSPGAGKLPAAPMASVTKAGPLTAIALDPSAIAQHLEPTATVTGFLERYANAEAAKPFLVGLPKMTVENTPREVHGTGWGYTITQLTYEGGKKYPMHISVLVIATPDTAGGWRIGAVHYAKP